MGEDRSAAAEAVHRVVGRDSIEDLTEDAALDRFESWLGRFEETIGAGAFGDPGVAVVAQAGIDAAAKVTPFVCEPRELHRVEPQPTEHVARGREGWEG